MNAGVGILCTAAAVAAGAVGTMIFNAVPARWLCDYGEQPRKELQQKRIFLFPHGAVLAILFAVFFLLSFRQYGNQIRFWAAAGTSIPLALTGIADLKYRIIPDEFVFCLFITGLVFHGGEWVGNGFHPAALISPLAGAAAGAALMLLIGLLGRCLYHRDAMGFGDVKLFAAAGFFTGISMIVPFYLIAVFLAFFHILFLFAAHKMPEDRYFPFGFSICLALMFFLAFSGQISEFIAWYFSLLNL